MMNFKSLAYTKKDTQLHHLDDYDVIAIYDCDTANGHKKYVDGDAKKPYKCRFCGKNETEEKFSEHAHAISNLLGNKNLFLKSECDSCNEKFGILYEDQLAKYLSPARTLLQIKGKNQIPAYKSRDGKIRIDAIDNGLAIQEKNGSDGINFGEKTMKISLPRYTYVPIKVFKSLVFIAFSLIPEKELSEYSDVQAYLQDIDDKKYDMRDYTSKVVEYFVTGNNPLPIRAIVLRRKKGKNMPYSIFLLEFSNFIYQIILPCHNKDARLCKQKMNIPLMAQFIEENPQNKEWKYRIIDWTSNERINGELFYVDIEFDKKETTGDYKSILEKANLLNLKFLK